VIGPQSKEVLSVNAEKICGVSTGFTSTDVVMFCIAGTIQVAVRQGSTSTKEKLTTF